MNDIDIDKIWSILDCHNDVNITSSSPPKCSQTCPGCDSLIYESVCNQCGLILNNNQEYSSYNFEEPIQHKSYAGGGGGGGNSRLKKMQEWMMWTNEEKTEYKLNKYTRELCDKLQIHDSIIHAVCNLVSQVMNAIKNSCDGPKRSRVKDGIIIVCIYYISKGTSSVYSYIELAKKIELNMKYISKADKLLMELINSNNLILSKEFMSNFYKTETPIDYVTKIIDKYQLNINKKILEQVVELISICEDNDILLDHTPLSVGVSCFYYILDINNIDINVKMFSELYDLSMVTVLKTFNKLKVHKINFEKMGILPIIFDE
jgi:transcription initiation factor TFIIIB Brf1 subunit/transcription initiation factor TFIIB